MNRNLRVAGVTAVVAVAALILSSCTGARFDSERNEKLDAVVEALKAGNGSAYCSAINALEPGACDIRIEDSAGLPDVELDSFEISEGEFFSHTIAAANFNFSAQSMIYETEDGKKLGFVVVDYRPPSLVLPHGGTLNGNMVQPETTVYFMPSSEPIDVQANSDPSGFFDIELIMNPWVNRVEWEVVASPNQDALIQEIALASCEEFKESVGYSFFGSGRDGESRNLFNPGPFRPTPDAVDSEFKDPGDQSGNRISSRTINSPSNLDLGPCALQESTRSENFVEWSWTFEAGFQGIIGEKAPNRFGNLRYNGDTIDASFSTKVFGSTAVNFDGIAFGYETKPVVTTGRAQATFPMVLTILSD